MWIVADAGVGVLALLLWAHGIKPARSLLLFSGFLLPGVLFGVAPGVAGLIFFRWLALSTIATHLTGFTKSSQNPCSRLTRSIQKPQLRLNGFRKKDDLRRCCGIRRPSVCAVRSNGEADFSNTAHFIALVLIIQTLIVPFELFHHPRAAGVSINAYMLGEVGLALFMMIPRRGGVLVWVTSAVYLAGSLTRSTMGVAVVYSLLRRDRWLVIGALGICLLFAMVLVVKSHGGLSRLDPQAIRTAAEIRWALNTGEIQSRNTVIDALGPLAPEYSPAAITWMGYGLGGYVAATGLQRPHSLFVLLAYELGVFGLGVLSMIVYWVYKGHMPLSFFITLGLLGLFTEDLAIRPEIQYIFFAVAVVHLSYKHRHHKATDSSYKSRNDRR